MLNRKSAMVGPIAVGFSRVSNEGLFIRRVAAFAEESKIPASDDVASTDWNAADGSLRVGGNSIFWSADNLSMPLRDVSGASFAQLDSPKSSNLGTPTRCTGGGHGEAGPTSPGGFKRLSSGSDPVGAPQSLSPPTRKPTPLARHLAERNLLSRSVRRSVDCAPPQLRTRDSAPHPVSPTPGAALPATSQSTSFDKLPSFLRTTSIHASGTENSSPQRLPDPNQQQSGHYAHASSGVLVVPWLNSKESSPTNSRALTPVPVGSATRPSRHILLGARQPRTPKSVPSSGHDGGFMDVGLTARSRASTGSIPATAKPPPMPPVFTPRATPSNGLVYLWLAAPPAMRRGDWSMSQFTIARQLYGGYASTVFKAKCQRSGQDVVLKVYALSSLSDFLRNQVLRELDIHSRLEHPGVVQLLASFREDNKLVMVLEYVRGGSLDRARRKLGGRMSEQQALELVMVPLLRTLHYLHTRSIVHRDIKPENVLFTSDWKLKVCDYGVSVCLAEERAVTRTGSRDYMAPEVQVCPLKRAPDDNKGNAQLAYGAAADIWSLGVLTYELLVGFTPFPGGPPPVDDRVTAGRSPAFPSCISSDARSFVMSCLMDIPVDRPTIYELLKHRWVQGALLGAGGGVGAGRGGAHGVAMSAGCKSCDVH